MCNSISQPVKYSIYCDMDGVLTNFAKPMLDILNTMLITYNFYNFLGKDRRLNEQLERISHGSQIIHNDFLTLIRDVKADIGDQPIVLNHIKSPPIGTPSAIKLMVAVMCKNTNFWADLPWKMNGQKLWGFVSKYNPAILSRPQDEFSIKGKLIWLSQRLNPPPAKIILETNKYIYANPASILIDDYEVNIALWEQHGGIGVFYDEKNITSVINTLETFFHQET